MTLYKLQHTPGVVRVNVVELVIDHHDAKIWEIDLNTKYPDLYQVVTPFDEDEGEGDLHEVRLIAGDRTLRVDPTITTATVFGVETTPGQNWLMIAEAARYSCQIVLYRRETYALP